MCNRIALLYRRNKHIIYKLYLNKTKKILNACFNEISTDFLWPFVVQSLSCVSLPPHELQHTGFPVLHYLPKFSQTHVQWVGDAMQPSHPLSSPSPLALKFSQHRDLFQWVGSSHLWPFNPVLIDMLPEFTKIVYLCSPGFFQEINSQTCDLWHFYS